jgi:glucokinase
MILAGDIGGTKTYLGLFKIEDNYPIAEEIKEYSSQSYSSFRALVQDFLKQSSQKIIDVACFGIAGPIKTDNNERRSCKMSNIREWPVIKEDDLSYLKNCEKILINDLEAIGYGISRLSEDELVELNQGKPQKGNRAVIAAGTGLGQLMLYWDGHEHIPLASEGGHADFAARDKFEYELQNYLCGSKKKLVNSHEVLSGKGLVNICEFLISRGEYSEESTDFRKRLKKSKKADKPPMISEAALKDKNPLCIKALDVFFSIYGAQARNLALQCLPVNGLYIGGSIAQKILDQEILDNKSRKKTFMESFANGNGEFSKSYLRNIPVKVIKNTKVGLLGAAWRGKKTIEVNHK